MWSLTVTSTDAITPSTFLSYHIRKLFMHRAAPASSARSLEHSSQGCRSLNVFLAITSKLELHCFIRPSSSFQHKQLSWDISSLSFWFIWFNSVMLVQTQQSCILSWLVHLDRVDILTDHHVVLSGLQVLLQFFTLHFFRQQLRFYRFFHHIQTVFQLKFQTLQLGFQYFILQLMKLKKN